MRLFIFSFVISFIAGMAQAFCGFYVARADGDLFNEASKVVFVRDGNRSVITMSSDYRGPAAEFAMIVPAPSVLRRDQIRTVKGETIAHLDGYSAPRLVEYEDDDPCHQIAFMMAETSTVAVKRRGPAAHGVTIEAQYAVGVYDVLILSARESNGLTTYLRQEDYNIPEGAQDVLADYISKGMKFFVARVNLERHSGAQSADLPPLQISFNSRNFMLPLQLGKVNSTGKQEVLLMTLTRSGRVEAANYDNVFIPTDFDVPVFVADEFGDFYKALFKATNRRNSVVTEYAWDMAWCDPCAADPLSVAELRELGVNWVKSDENAGQDVYVTRLHFAYTKRQFKQDLELRVTDDRENFQGRFVIRHPFRGALLCDEGQSYKENVRNRLLRAAGRYQEITNMEARAIRRKIRQSTQIRYWY